VDLVAMTTSGRDVSVSSHPTLMFRPHPILSVCAHLSQWQRSFREFRCFSRVTRAREYPACIPLRREYTYHRCVCVAAPRLCHWELRATESSEASRVEHVCLQYHSPDTLRLGAEADSDSQYQPQRGTGSRHSALLPRKTEDFQEPWSTLQ
jgi:hypothetical protein